ncbi:Protein of unknown function [Pelagirhabdus alkalitolerans]|uniref:DUF2812 domain-containing protein n=1 Tax=Pelagirhabdus alkalitolerans TaxID=1612202 RepID=A0A1G6GIQ1_9BACI|nr:DUF2812 domain-containing protein [Pelagirhabdus alkalitolerans]SDB81892.1 Protein of unknown function [Pelagirhabdus alkalitolerans]
MIKKTFWKPFWSYHIQGTEKWLERMANEGYTLSRIQPKLSRFTFIKEPSTHQTFNIAFDRTQHHTLPQALQEDDWEMIDQKRKWGVYGNSKQKDDVKTSMVRDQLMSRNSKIEMAWWIFFIYILFNLLLQTSLGLIIYFNEGTVNTTRVESPFWIVTYIVLAVQLVIIIIGVYSLVMLKKESRRLKNASTDNDITLQTRDKPKNTSTNKRHFYKFSWIYSPDKLESWLEEKEQLGWHLTYVYKSGLKFQFEKSEPKLYAYHVQFEPRSDSSAHSLYSEAGWECIYTTSFSWHHWSIWRQSYSKEAEKPNIHHDQASQKQEAMRIAKIHTWMYSPVILIFAFNFFSFMLPRALEEGYFSLSRIEQFNTVIFPLAMSIFLVSVARAWFYYFRVRNKQNQIE